MNNEESLAFPYKVKHTPVLYLTIPLLDSIYLRDIKTCTRKDLYEKVLSSFIHNKQCPPTKEWTRRLWSIYTIEYCSAMKKERTAITHNDVEATEERYVG